MQFVPASKPRSAWRGVILFFAALLTLGVLAPVTASAHGYPHLRVCDTAVDEGDHDYTLVKVKIALKHAAHKKVSVGWDTHSGTAKAWKDFKPTAGRAYFKKGQKVAFAKVLVKGDHKYEGDEYFYVHLFKPRGAVIKDAWGKVTILDDDLPELTVYKDVAMEGSDLLFVVKLSAPAPVAVTFNYAIKDITTTPADYTAPTTPATATTPALPYGSASIAAGADKVVLHVPTTNDTLKEDTEFLKVKLFHVTGADVLDNDALGVILDND